MNERKAYPLLAIGVVLQLFGRVNWMLALCGWGLCVYGASELAARRTRYYGAAVTFAAGMMLLTLLARVMPAASEPSAALVLLLVALHGLTLVCAMLFFAALCVALSAQMKDAGRGGRLEWGILVLFTVHYVTELLGGTWLNAIAQQFGAVLSLAAGLAAMIALLADLYRAQKSRAEGDGNG